MLYDRCHHALNNAVFYIDISHPTVLRVQSHTLMFWFRIVTLQRCLIIYQRNNNIAFLCIVLLTHNHQITMIDIGLDYGISISPENIKVSLTEKSDGEANIFLDIFYSQLQDNAGYATKDEALFISFLVILFS